VLTLSSVEGEKFAGNWFRWELQIAERNSEDWTG
jgi:hypothetical protein